MYMTTLIAINIGILASKPITIITAPKGVSTANIITAISRKPNEEKSSSIWLPPFKFKIMPIK